MNGEPMNWEEQIQREDFWKGVAEEFAARLKERSQDPMKSQGLDFGNENETPTLAQLFARLYGRLILADILLDRGLPPELVAQVSKIALSEVHALERGKAAPDAPPPRTRVKRRTGNAKRPRATEHVE